MSTLPLLRRLPVVATLLVLAAVGVMIWLGFWQLDRRGEKAAMLAHYAAAAQSPAEVNWPVNLETVQDVLYRRSRLTCARVSRTSAIAGRNVAGVSGLAIIANCEMAGGEEVMVALGWSRAPMVPDWQGGEVSGIVAPGPRLIADPPLAGLEASARPDPSKIPDSHLAYAVQWFLFAATALVIYGLAVRKRLARGGEDR